MRFQTASALFNSLVSCRSVAMAARPSTKARAASTGGMAGGASTGGTGTSGANDCEEQSCCLANRRRAAKETEIWRRPLDAACAQPAEFREACEYGCAVSTLYEFAYCEDAPQRRRGWARGRGRQRQQPVKALVAP